MMLPVSFFFLTLQRPKRAVWCTSVSKGSVWCKNVFKERLKTFFVALKDKTLGGPISSSIILFLKLGPGHLKNMDVLWRRFFVALKDKTLGGPISSSIILFLKLGPGHLKNMGGWQFCLLCHSEETIVLTTGKHDHYHLLPTGFTASFFLTFFLQRPKRAVWCTSVCDLV